jgi:hypothetical protein
MSTPFEEGQIATLVANRLRVAVVECLAEQSGSKPIDLDDLAELVARQYTEVDTGQLEVGLHHLHLDTLDRAGVIDYDASSLTVEPGSPDVLDALVTRVEVAATEPPERTSAPDGSVSDGPAADGLAVDERVGVPTPTHDDDD